MVIVDVNSAIDCILRNRNKAKLKFIPPSKMNHDHDVKPFAIFLGIDDVSSTTVNSVNGSTKRSPNTTQHTILPRSFQYENVQRVQLGRLFGGEFSAYDVSLDDTMNQMYNVDVL